MPSFAFTQYNQVNFYPPEAASLMRNIDYPVSHLTGMPDIRIPLHTIKAGPLTIPFEISFHIDNFAKANQMPASTGAGWSLNTEIQISRSINGLDDLKSNNGYCFNNNIPANYTSGDVFRTNAQKKQVVDGYKEEEPDKFFYQLLGKSGSFYFQKQANGSFLPIPVPFNGIKINYNFTTLQFTIIDTDGTTYLFAASDYTTEPNMTNLQYMSWKCQSIKNAAGVQEVSFTYTNGYQTQELSYNDRIEVYDDMIGYAIGEVSAYSPRCESIHPFEGVQSWPFWQVMGPKMIRWGGGSSKVLAWNHEGYFQEVPNYATSGSPSQIEKNVRNFPVSVISFRGGSIVFNYINNEQLSSIQVKNGSGVTIKNIAFYQSYAGSGGGLIYNNNKYRYSRILDSLHINDQKYAFTYGLTRQYGDVSDYWGYQADAPSNACMVPYQSITLSVGNTTNYYDCFTTTEGETLSATFGTGATPGEMFGLTNLQKTAIAIRYPTGGSTEFIVGQNRFRDPGDQTIKGAGGYRIEKIRSFDQVHAGPVNEKIYKYGPDEDGTGIIKSLPSFDPLSGNNYIDETNQYVVTGILDAGHIEIVQTSRKRTYLSGATRGLTFSNGAPVNYNTVTEYNSDMGLLTGKTVYKYNLYTYEAENTSPSDPFPFENNDWHKGMPDSVIHYKYQNGQFTWIRKKNMDYNTYIFPYRVFQGRTSLRGNYILIAGPGLSTYTQDYLTENFGNMEFKYSAINVGTMQLTNEDVAEQDADGHILTSRTNYYYTNPDPSVVTRIENTGSDGITTIQHITYPTDYAPAGFITPLITNNIVSVPVEKVIRKNGKVVSGQVLTYNSNGTLSSSYQIESNPPLHQSSFKMSNRATTGDYSPASSNTTFGKDPNYLQKLSLDWDNYLNLKKVTPVGNMSTSYLWDYENIYPIAEVKNAESDQMAFTSFEADGAGNWGIQSNTRNTSYSITGKQSYDLANGTLTKSGLDPAKTYVLTYWIKTGASLSANGTQSTSQGKSVNDWNFYTKTISGISSLTVSGNGLVDEIRLFSQGAQMNTYTYEPLIGMTSQCDVNNRITYYEYDGFGRLKTIRDENKNVLKTLDYQYQKNQNQ